MKELIDNGGFAFTSLKALGGWNAVKDLAFENLVLNHYPEFAARLGLSTTLVKSAAPYVKRGVTLRTALVYSGELDPEVAASGYFNAIVDIEEVM